MKYGHLKKNHLTLSCRMYFPILINWTISFQILGLFVGSFHFHLIFKRNFCFANRREPDQTPRFAASGLVLHCLSMSHMG